MKHDAVAVRQTAKPENPLQRHVARPGGHSAATVAATVPPPCNRKDSTQSARCRRERHARKDGPGGGDAQGPSFSSSLGSRAFGRTLLSGWLAARPAPAMATTDADGVGVPYPRALVFLWGGGGEEGASEVRRAPGARHPSREGRQVSFPLWARTRCHGRALEPYS